MQDTLGRSRRRFQVGSGFYTASDVERGTTPTPSQAARGVLISDPEARWFALTRDEKRAWQAVATPPWTGRTLYTTLNRMRWNGFNAPVQHPPGGPLEPDGPPIFGVSATSDYEGVGVGAYVWSAQGRPLVEILEIAIYKPAEGSPGAGGAGARWLLASSSLLDNNDINDFGSLFGGFQRGPNLSFWTAPTPSLGDTIRVRFLRSTSEGYPGTPQYFTVTVQP